MTARKIPLGWALVPWLVTITGLLAAIFWVKAPLYIGLLLGFVTAICIAKAHRFAWRTLFVGTGKGVQSTLMVIVILLLIAGVISAWMASGTVPGLILYGIRLIRPDYLVMTAFLLTAVASMALGSSVGTLSTMGAAIVGIAGVYGISPALIGGALVSGAMVGDRSSPVSGTFHLLANMTGTKAEDNYKPLWQTGAPMILLSVLFFAWQGYGKATVGANVQQNSFLREIGQHYHVHWFLLLPPLLVLLLAVLRVPIRRNLLFGILFGLGLAVFVQRESFLSVLHALWLGFRLEDHGQVVLQGGGIWPMFNEVLLIAFAGALNGVMQETGMMGTILQLLIDRIRTQRGLLLSTIGLSVVMAMIACNQAMSVIVPGSTLRATYDHLRVPPRELVRSLSDSGVLVAPIIPWNLHGILCSAAIGIATTVYFPYTFYLLGSVLLGIVISVMGNVRTIQIK